MVCQVQQYPPEGWVAGVLVIVQAISCNSSSGNTQCACSTHNAHNTHTHTLCDLAHHTTHTHRTTHPPSQAPQHHLPRWLQLLHQVVRRCTPVSSRDAPHCGHDVNELIGGCGAAPQPPTTALYQSRLLEVQSWRGCRLLTALFAASGVVCRLAMALVVRPAGRRTMQPAAIGNAV